MKAIIIVVTLLCLAGQAVFSEETLESKKRTWTSSKGSTLEAEFVRLQGDIVFLRTEDGRLVKIDITKLIHDDQIIARKLASEVKKQIKSKKKQPVSPAIKSLFGEKLVNAKKEKISLDALGGKKIGIYFSAHWCPPCKVFTPKLVKFYNELKKQDKPLEIVFVSSDRSSSAMFKYMKEADMPWLAVPHRSKKIKELSQSFGIRGIPALVIVDAEGKTLTKNGRGDVVNFGTKAFDRW